MESDSQHDALSVGEVMLGSLIDDAHTIRPDDIVPVVRRKGALVGLDDIVILLADWDQRELAPLEGEGEGAGADDRCSIEGSMAGRAYQRTEVLLGDGDGDRPVGWFPLLDGASRLGVMRARLRRTDAVTLGRGRQLAGLVAGLIATKRTYGDNLVRAGQSTMPTLAAQLRWATLPPLAFDQKDVVSIGAILEPAYDIAGDTFDYALDGELLHFAIFDAMGHGLAASQMATLAVFAYRHARRQRQTLDAIYRAVDEVVADQYGADAFVTAQLCSLDLRSGLLHCVNAGHPLPLIVRGRTSVNEVPFETSAPIGIGDAEARLTELHLQPGDTVVFYSDGVTEARSRDGEQFGIDRLGDLLVRSADAGLTPAETARRVAHAVVDHHQIGLDDDATLLTVTWHGAPR